MMNLYFIGGASGSGKTAVMSELAKIASSKFKIYDFDDFLQCLKDLKAGREAYPCR